MLQLYVKRKIITINGRIENDCSIYWSGIETIKSSIRTWTKGNKYITLQPGTYIIGLKAEAACTNNIYIDTKIDTNAENFIPYEKTCLLPPSSIQSETTYRSLSYSFPWKIDQTTTLFPFVYTYEIENVTCEIFAIKLK